MSDNLSHAQGLCAALNSGALAAGTNTGTIKTTVAINYVLDGRHLSKAITDNIGIAVVGGPAIYQAAAGGVATFNGAFTGGVTGSTRLYLLSFDAAGNVGVVTGRVVDGAELAAGRVSLEYPDCPNLMCPFGAMRVALTSGAAFVPGTTALNAAGVTTTFINLATVPANPLTA
jgi:hypothetical protein